MLKFKNILSKKGSRHFRVGGNPSSELGFFEQGGLNLSGPEMDPRLRGNDEAFVTAHFVI